MSLYVKQSIRWIKGCQSLLVQVIVTKYLTKVHNKPNHYTCSFLLSRMPCSVRLKTMHIPLLRSLSVPNDPAPYQENFEISQEASKKMDEISKSQGSSILDKDITLMRLRGEWLALSVLSRTKNEYEFRVQLNLDLNILNGLIHAYNSAPTVQEKIIFLQNIEEKQRLIDMKYPDYLINDCVAYQQISQSLFVTCQGQAALLARRTQNNSDAVAADNPPILEDIIAKMSPEKIALLMQFLSGKIKYQDELQQLYAPDEQEFAAFQDFLSTHAISFLGGENSSNFKVMQLQTRHTVVLKIDNRLENPKQIAWDISTRVSHDVFLKEMVSRRGTFMTVNMGVTTRYLVIKEYCASKDLLVHAKEPLSDKEHIAEAVAIYRKMASILQDIRQHKGAFLDMKNTNWLLHLGQLRIADDKSLRAVDKAGNLDRFSENSRWYGRPIRTFGINPPEIDEDPPISVDKLHAFMFGKNLYEYLVHGDSRYLHTVNDGVLFDFSLPLFKTEVGLLFKALIEATVKPKPSDRVSMSDVVTLLDAIQLKHSETMAIHAEYVTQCYALLEDIQTYDNDLVLGTAVILQYKDMLKEADQDQLKDITSTLKAYLGYVQSLQRCHTLFQALSTYQQQHSTPELEAFIDDMSEALFIPNVSRLANYELQMQATLQALPGEFCKPYRQGQAVLEIKEHPDEDQLDEKSNMLSGQ